MGLAVRTGIPPGVWAAEGEAAVLTALELIQRSDEAAAKAGRRK